MLSNAIKNLFMFIITLDCTNSTRQRAWHKRHNYSAYYYKMINAQYSQYINQFMFIYNIRMLDM